MPISTNQFLTELDRLGYNFYTGVPCSFIGPLFAALGASGERVKEVKTVKGEERSDALRSSILAPRPYLAAVREDNALGIAAGAFLGGKKPVVLMQNSGLGVSINALASLHLIYKIPTLLIISLRGYEIHDAPEHMISGPITPTLLDTLKIPHRICGDATWRDDLAFAIDHLEKHRLPAALLFRKDSLTQ
jgi:sulfopyruvate decarboxylase TPP-binding subunit